MTVASSKRGFSLSHLIRLSELDDIAVAVRPVSAGQSLDVDGEPLLARERIPPGHKIALRLIREGEPVHKFGQVIGFASKDIEPGQHVHTQNVSCDQFERSCEFGGAVPTPPTPEARWFEGYTRPDGRVGTRNYIALVSTVNCSASTCRAVVEKFSAQVMREYPNVDGVIAVTHKTGCGMNGSGVDALHLRRTLAGFARHPNVADYVLVGLGCETNQPSELIAAEQLIRPDGRPPRVFSIQGMGGTSKTIAAVTRAVAEILPRANDARRASHGVDKIVLGTNCGGSDGYSGITANPALGVASDAIVALGGTSILGETTEIYGAEHLLTRRAVSRAVGEKLIERIKWWEWYTSVLGGAINNNPSPGNKEGGLTTIYEKSLGAIAKGGRSPLTAVYDYAEPVQSKGFVVMDTPGLDPTSVTGIVAGGANVVVFTTGRGSVFGCKPTPSIKVATNSPLYEHLEEDMDFNAGVILTGEPIEVVGQRLFDLILDTASGRKTKSEILGVGEEEFSPWIVGPVL